jgi:hypothetical protein
MHGNLNSNLTFALPNGSIGLQVGGWINWGTSAKLAMTNANRGFSGSTAVATQNGLGALGVHMTSGLQVDFIDSATGAGIQLFDKIQATTTYPLKTQNNTLDDGSGKANFTNLIQMPGGTSSGPGLWFNSAGPSDNFGNSLGVGLNNAYTIVLNAGGGGVITAVAGTKHNTLDDGAGNQTISGAINATANNLSILDGLGGIQKNDANWTRIVYNFDFMRNSVLSSSYRSAELALGNGDLRVYMTQTPGNTDWTNTLFEVQSTGAVNTAKNILDDGSGNQTIIGNLSVAGANGKLIKGMRNSLGVGNGGSNRLWLEIDNASMANGSGGNGASIQFAESGTYYWEIIENIKTVGSSYPDTDCLNFWYDGTGSGAKLSIFGNGEVLTGNNIRLDDGHGNIISPGDCTITAPSKGFVLTDRVNGHTYRLVMNSGNVSTEQVS